MSGLYALVAATAASYLHAKTSDSWAHLRELGLVLIEHTGPDEIVTAVRATLRQWHIDLTIDVVWCHSMSVAAMSTATLASWLGWSIIWLTFAKWCCLSFARTTYFFDNAFKLLDATLQGRVLITQLRDLIIVSACRRVRHVDVVRDCAR